MDTPRKIRKAHNFADLAIKLKPKTDHPDWWSRTAVMSSFPRKEQTMDNDAQHAFRPETNTPEAVRERVYTPAEHARHYAPLNKELHAADAQQFGWKAENGTFRVTNTSAPSATSTSTGLQVSSSTSIKILFRSMLLSIAPWDRETTTHQRYNQP